MTPLIESSKPLCKAETHQHPWRTGRSYARQLTTSQTAEEGTGTTTGPGTASDAQDEGATVKKQSSGHAKPKVFCRSCGAPSSSGLCPNCRYRNGGPLKEQIDEYHDDIVAHMRRPFRVRIAGLRNLIQA